ncbi:hypothetical protein AB4298_17545 [Shewanella sp. 10N.261.52.F9]|uniref:hypothetical protein n=1 Tax=Shewanella sp. 10N.261.52.F9 TaxID=3229684 RepID=UPI00354F2614
MSTSSPKKSNDKSLQTEGCVDTYHLWVFHNEKPKAGRRLKLLEADEIVFALPLIYRLITLADFNVRAEWFVDFELEERNSHYIKLSESLSALNQQRKGVADLTKALAESNRLLNRYFSDYGWRMVRKELSQIKKRKKKSHIEISNDLVMQLKEYMAANQIDTFDQAIDSLLSDQRTLVQLELKEAEQSERV